MDRKLDSKHIKTLADILALVLVDQPGESMAALEAVRRRARQDGLTGGALKELVQTLSQTRPAPWVPPRASSTAQVDQLRAALLETQRRFVETRLELDRAKREAVTLRRRVEQLYTPLQQSRRSLAEAALLRTRVAQLEHQLDRAHSHTGVNAMPADAVFADATMATAPSPGKPHRARNRVRFRPLAAIRLAQAMAGLVLLLGLATDHTATPAIGSAAPTVVMAPAHRPPAGPPLVIAL